MCSSKEIGHQEERLSVIRIRHKPKKLTNVSFALVKGSLHACSYQETKIVDMQISACLVAKD